MRYAIVFGLIALLAGCVSSTNGNYTQTVSSWRGGNVNALMARWGTPSDQITGPKGNTAYIYNTQSYRAIPTNQNPSIGVHYTDRSAPVITNTNPAVMNAAERGSISMNCTAIFLANPKGQIIDTQVQGVACYGGSHFKNRMGNPTSTATNGD